MNKWAELRDYAIQQLLGAEAGEHHEYEKAMRMILGQMDALDEKVDKKRVPLSDGLFKQLVFDCAMELLHEQEGATREQVGMRLLDILRKHDDQQEAAKQAFEDEKSSG